MVFDLFKEGSEGPKDVKTIRDRLLQFIKKQLQKSEGGEAKNILGFQLFIACNNAEKHIYESALYFEEQDKFKNEEVQRIADDFAIALPDQWTMKITFVETLPPEAIKAPELDAALLVITRKRAIHSGSTAYIKVLNGEAEKEVYTITSGSARINIGREKKVLTPDSFYRLNNIAFPANSKDESNKFISRQHAHIEYNNETGIFVLFADEGGIPPRNKTKILSINESSPVTLHSVQIGHLLQEGDQIVLGESAVLQFSYSDAEI